MLFDKDIRKICAFCEYASDFDDNIVLCEFHGPVSQDHCCRRFTYDPLRRKPSLPPKMKKALSEDAFQL